MVGFGALDECTRALSQVQHAIKEEAAQAGLKAYAATILLKTGLRLSINHSVTSAFLLR